MRKKTKAGARTGADDIAYAKGRISFYRQLARDAAKQSVERRYLRHIERLERHLSALEARQRASREADLPLLPMQLPVWPKGVIGLKP